MAWLTVAVPAGIAQSYLATATGKLTVLPSADAIHKHPLTKYYSLKEHYIDKQHIALYRKVSVSGKNNQYLDFTLFVTCPILSRHILLPQAEPDTSIKINMNKVLVVVNGHPAPNNIRHTLNPADIASVSILRPAVAVILYGPRASSGAMLITLKNAETNLASGFPNAWLGLQYNEQISNSLSNEDKEQAYRKFLKDSQDKFNAANLDAYTYLERAGNTGDHDNYLKAIRSLPQYNNASPIILEARQGNFAERTGSQLFWMLGTLAGGCLIWLLLLLTPKLHTTEVKKYLTGHELKPLISLKLLKQVFTRRPVFWASPMLIGLNLFIFMIMVFAGLGFINFDAPDLLAWGADYGPLTLNGQWWRVLSCLFLHGGIMHVLNNMYGLFFCALFLEPLISSKRFIIMYMICGIAGSLTSLWWHPTTVSVGASGAIMGMFGVFLALLTTSRVPVGIRSPMLVNCGIFIGFTLLMGLGGGVDNAAHLGGLLCGLCIGYALHLTMPAFEPKFANERESRLVHHIEDNEKA